MMMTINSRQGWQIIAGVRCQRALAAERPAQKGVSPRNEKILTLFKILGLTPSHLFRQQFGGDPR
jgi:hypothetical protein